MQGYVGGLLRLGGEPGCIEICWRTSLCKGESWCGQLEEETDGQRSLMEEV